MDANYGRIYVHIYDGCNLRHKNFLKSETTTRSGDIVCQSCKGYLIEQTVTFALVPWRGDGHYSLADAIATYAGEKRAEAHASKLYEADQSSPYVVRTFTH